MAAVVNAAGAECAAGRRAGGWYRNRWLIEQYHKALKAGCRMEASQLQQGQALTRLLGFLYVVAVRLLQVESAARTVPDLPADRTVDTEMLVFLGHLRHLDPASITVYQFWRELAKLGGFLARKHDGEPAGKPSGGDGMTSIPALKAIC
jgi:hypothetical protein